MFRFAAFRLDPVSRQVWRDAAPITLHGRQFDTLAYLLAQNGRLVPRAELIDAVWPGRHVEENNLGQAVSGLRRTLGEAGAPETLIITVPGRGYRIGVPVSLDAAPGEPAPKLSQAVPKPPRNWRPIAGVAALALILAGATAWRLRPHAGVPPPPPPHSIAVLPFTNLTGDPAQDYLGDGMAEQLIESLGQIGALHVAARQSAFSFKGQAATAADIARRLNVGTVLEGSLQRAGKRLHIATSLIDGTTGFQLWAASYDDNANDALAAETRIATAVTAALRGVVQGGDSAQLTQGGTSDPVAFDAYLRGMQRKHLATVASMRDAIASFSAAVKRDPGYAMAFAQRADTLEDLSQMDSSVDDKATRDMQQQASGDAARAIALAPGLGVAHATMGRMLAENRFDFSGALAEIKTGLSLAPGDAATAMQSAVMLSVLGELPQAVAAARQAAAQDPLTAATYLDLGGVLFQARRYDDALQAWRHAMQLSPVETSHDIDLHADIELALGHPAEAARICANASDWAQRQVLAVAEHSLGHQDRAAANFAALQAELGDTGAVQYAEILAQWGQKDAALTWLETALRLRDPGLLELRNDQLLDPLRQDARFVSLARRLGMP